LLSFMYISMAMPIWRRLLLLDRYAKTAMTATTMITSTIVKPFFFIILPFFSICAITQKE